MPSDEFIDSFLNTSNVYGINSGETIAQLININNSVDDAEAYTIFSYRERASKNRDLTVEKIADAIKDVLSNHVFGDSCIVGYDFFHSSEEVRGFGYDSPVISNDDLSLTNNGRLIVKKRTLMPLSLRKYIIMEKMLNAEYFVSNALDSVASGEIGIGFDYGYRSNSVYLSGKFDKEKIFSCMIDVFTVGRLSYIPRSSKIDKLIHDGSNAISSRGVSYWNDPYAMLSNAFMLYEFDKDNDIDERLDYLCDLANKLKNIMMIWRYATRSLPFTWTPPTRMDIPIDTDTLTGIASLCGVDSMIDAFLSGVPISDLIPLDDSRHVFA